MSAVAAVPLRLLNHAFLPLFSAVRRRVDEDPLPTLHVAQSLPSVGRATQHSALPWTTADRYYEEVRGV
jgi:hypothetical protein